MNLPPICVVILSIRCGYASPLTAFSLPITTQNELPADLCGNFVDPTRPFPSRLPHRMNLPPICVVILSIRRSHASPLAAFSLPITTQNEPPAVLCGNPADPTRLRVSDGGLSPPDYHTKCTSRRSVWQSDHDPARPRVSDEKLSPGAIRPRSARTDRASHRECANGISGARCFLQSISASHFYRAGAPENVRRKY